MAEKKRYRSSVPGTIGSTRIGSSMMAAPRSGAMTPFNPGSSQFAEPFGQRPMDIRTFDAGVSQVIPRTPASPRMQYIPPSPVGQRSPNQPIPAVPQGQRLQLIPAINTGPRNLQESALSVGQFGQLPQSFQQRFQERQASGLNQGFTEQDAVNYYNQNYLSRGRGLQPDAGAVSYGPGAMRPSPQATQQPVQSQAPSFSGMSLADQLEQQRLAGQGMFAGPTPQERGQFNAAVVDRIRQNPSPINQFLGQELMGRTREGRQIGMEDLEQGYLSRPMQGGMMRGSTADTMRDRERRLAAIGAPARDTGAELTQTRMAQDRAVNEELARQGTTPEQLAEIARLTGRPEIADGGMAAVSILRPGTTIRGMGGGNVPFTIARGPEESSQRREQRLASLPARRERDRLAVANRLDRMRMGRQTMMANQQAAQRQAMEMATNPIANPMLLAGDPYAQAQAMRLGQQQREFLAGAPIREAQMLEQSLRNQGLMYQNQASQQMLSPEYQMQQRQERARDLLTRIDPAVITAMGPDGQRFMQGLYRDAAGLSDGQASGPPAPPTTAVEAQGVVQQLSPSVQAVIGDDPANYNSEELAYKLKQMQELGMQITPQDIQTINEYSAARTMYDTRFATTGRSRASRMWERVTSP